MDLMRHISRSLLKDFHPKIPIYKLLNKCRRCHPRGSYEMLSGRAFAFNLSPVYFLLVHLFSTSLIFLLVKTHLHPYIQNYKPTNFHISYHFHYSYDFHQQIFIFLLVSYFCVQFLYIRNNTDS